MDFAPDYRNFQQVMANQRPDRLPLYEHIISPTVMETIMGTRFAVLYNGNTADLQEFFRVYCDFFRQQTYDVVTFEVCITSVLPGSGALSGGTPGPIQNRADFESYPWEEIPGLYWELAAPKFEVLAESLPAGMKAVGGIGNGVFELSEDLVGLEFLPFIQVDDPELYADIYTRIGDLMCELWKQFLDHFSHCFVACRFGDDLGFKSSLLTNPKTVRDNILPQYRRLISLVHAARLPFLYHSCGCIFEVMEDIIDAGINAKHSNEDAIAPFERWISDYGDRIGLLGGFDMDFLCTRSETEIFDAVCELGQRYRESAAGYALGSGNSIPDYVPAENYLAMVRAAREIRAKETT